uniref:Uncharacterized protein n=1 Tax=Panagrolaimus davidi TaxID=227884 RepID=A0A914Q1Y3_9BILA
MLDKNPEETMTATFNRIFICKNSRQSRNPVTNENEIFEYNFCFPLIKAIKNDSNKFQNLKRIVRDFVNSLENDEKINYFDIFAELLLSSELKENVDDEKHVENPIHFSSAAETVSSIPLKCERPKRSLNKNISYQECDENDECRRKRRKIAVSIKPSYKNSATSHFDLTEPTPKNTPENVDFDIVEYLHDGKLDRKLLVFTSKERKQCYEYMFVVHFCRCIKCFVQKKVIKIKPTIHDDGSRTFDFNTEKHICEPIEYLPENYQSLIIKPSNFKFVQRLTNGKMHPLLIIFDIKDKNMCYRFGFESHHNFFLCYGCKIQGQKFFARFIQYEGQTVVELSRFQHICKPQKYTP